MGGPVYYEQRCTRVNLVEILGRLSGRQAEPVLPCNWPTSVQSTPIRSSHIRAIHPYPPQRIVGAPGTRPFLQKIVWDASGTRPPPFLPGLCHKICWEVSGYSLLLSVSIVRKTAHKAGGIAK
eukprot:gene14781-biopygen8127